MLLSRAALIIELNHPVRLLRQVGDVESHTGKQLALMPFDLGDDAALLAPRHRLIVEILEELLHFCQGRPPHGPGQPMCDLLTQDVVGRQSDGVEITRFLQPLIDRGDRIGGIGPEEASSKVAASIPGDDRIKDVPTVVGTVDVAIAQDAAFQHAELVEQEVWVVAGAVEMPILGEERPGPAREQLSWFRRRVVEQSDRSGLPVDDCWPNLRRAGLRTDLARYWLRSIHGLRQTSCVPVSC